MCYTYFVTRKKRIIGTTIIYEGKTYPSIAALYRAWEGDKPSEKTFGIKLQKWHRLNPKVALTDEVICQLFKTRSGTHGLTYTGVRYAGPKDLHRAFKGEKITFGGFWQRLKAYKHKNPDTEPDDQAIVAMLTPANVFYKGIDYPSWAQLYKSVLGDKIVLHRFIGNIRAWQQANPFAQINDDVIEQSIRFMGGAHVSSYQSRSYPNLKALYDAQSQPKCLWGTFQNRVRKLGALRELSDEDIALLLQQKAKVKFFKGILYRWTHLPTGKVYIGISSQTLNERVRLHHRQAKDGTYTNPLSLQATIASDGLHSFKVEVLAEFDDEDSMKTAEEKAVREHDCIAPKGFNLQEGGRSWTKQGTDVEFEGVVYPSYSALAQAFGISEKLLDGRRRLGWTLKDALTTPTHSKNASSKPVVVQGVKFYSIREAAKAYGKSYTALYNKMDLGWSIEDALGLTGRAPLTRKAVSVNGVHFPSISAAARHYGNDPREVFWKMARGKTLEQALGLEGPGSED